MFVLKTSLSQAFVSFMSTLQESDISIVVSGLFFFSEQFSNKTGSLLFNDIIFLLFASGLIKTDSVSFSVFLSELSNFLVFFLAH